jgi:ubiquinol-cytochrome c reductase cytochrome c subunit
MRLVSVHLALAAFVAGVLFGHGPAAAASVENGKAAFVSHGCWQCHGFEGQGSVASSGGRVIADTQLPLEAFMAYVRSPTAAMPPFREQILSDADLTDIYAYLEARPKPKSAKDIPLLQISH